MSELCVGGLHRYSTHADRSRGFGFQELTSGASARRDRGGRQW